MVWIPGIPLWKALLRKGTLRFPNHQAPNQPLTRWWFQIFSIFTHISGRFPFWLIFFRWVETTNQLTISWWLTGFALFHQPRNWVPHRWSLGSYTISEWAAPKRLPQRCFSNDAGPTPRKMNGWEPKNTPQLEKEHHLNQTIMTFRFYVNLPGCKDLYVGEMGSMLIFGGVFVDCFFLLCPKRETVLQVKLSS